MGSISLIQISADSPPCGYWEFNDGPSNPTTGALLCEDLNRFVIRQHFRKQP